MLDKIKLKLKKIKLTHTGEVKHLRLSIKCKKKWCGNNYGGFYVAPEFLNENSIVYSFGIGEDISFDKAIIQQYKCNVYGFDPTPKSIKWIKNQSLPNNFNFYEFGLGNKSGIVDFFLPKNPNHVSGSIVIQNNVDIMERVTVQMKSLQDIVSQLGHKQIDILKIDIEGAEYDVIEDILKTDVLITQILIEFHDRLFEDGKSKTQKSISDLKDSGFEIFAISDSFEEISFINKKKISN